MCFVNPFHKNRNTKVGTVVKGGVISDWISWPVHRKQWKHWIEKLHILYTFTLCSNQIVLACKKESAIGTKSWAQGLHANEQRDCFISWDLGPTKQTPCGLHLQVATSSNGLPYALCLLEMWFKSIKFSFPHMNHGFLSLRIVKMFGIRDQVMAAMFLWLRFNVISQLLYETINNMAVCYYMQYIYISPAV